MELLVIGATGRTGKHVVEQGLRRGHDITAFARNPQKLADIQGLNEIIQGDALNLSDIRKAVQGQDAVIVAVGGSAIARNLIIAMREAGVTRLVVTSSRSIVATRPWLPITLAWLIFRGVYADSAREEGMIEMSGLDWSIVRATMLTNQPFTGQVHVDFEANATGGALTLGRADYAMTLLDVVENPQMINKALGVCGAKPVKRQQLQASPKV
jgi:putative NADH-flavin reductase